MPKYSRSDDKPVKNYYERILGADIRNAGLEGWKHDYRFHPERRWKMDWAHPELLICAEIEGGIWTGGRHTQAQGFIKDLEKYEAAQRMGYVVYRCSPDMVKAGRAIDTIKILIDLRSQL